MVHNIADVTPNSVATALAAARTPANWLQISTPAGNAGDLRIGDSTTSATSGLVVPKGTTGLTLQSIADTQYLDLARVFVFATGTDKCSVLYGTH